jgi:hypothetical protein
MDLDKFIEKDMMEFLDKQAMLVAEKAAGLREEEFDLYEITKDYTKEISEALKDGDLKKAQKTFDDVKNRYLRAPDVSLSKKRLYAIMEEIYERIKDYESKEEGKKSLFETIKDYEEKGFFNRPDLFQGKDTTSLNIILSSVAGKEKELEKITAKKPFRRDDLQKAVEIYRDLKELIKRLPQTSQGEKERIYDATLSWYYVIKKLKESLDSEEVAKQEQAAKKETRVEQEKNVEQMLAEVRKLKQEIVESHNKIAQSVKNRDLNASLEEYRHLRSLIETVPQQMEEEKTALLADALSLHESIKKLRESLGAQEADRGSEHEIEEKEEKEEADDRKQLKQDINRRLEKVKSFLSQKDSGDAIKEYNELKDVFKNYPEQPMEEKKQLYDQIVSAHKDLLAIEEDAKKKNAGRDEKEIADIKSKIGEVHSLLDKGRSDEATHLMLEINHRIQMLPKEVFDAKYELVKESEKLEHKLVFVKNVSKFAAPSPPKSDDNKK